MAYGFTRETNLNYLILLHISSFLTNWVTLLNVNSEDTLNRAHCMG